MAYIEIRDLNFSYPNCTNKALNSINLSINSGEYVVLCGRSGSGKSTLLRHMKTVLRPHGVRTGSVCIGGTGLDMLDSKTQASAIGFVMQNPDHQIVTDKVWHELAFGPESVGIPAQTMRLRIAEMANFFGIQSWFHRSVEELSGGQKQLLNLASVMVMQPQILILDEPTAQLDPIAAGDFLATVRRINRELGTTVIITEHRLEDICHAADRIVVMDGGCIVTNDTPRAAGADLLRKKHPMFAALPTPVRVYCACREQGEAPLTVREGRLWLKNAGRAFVRRRLPTASAQFGAPALTVRDVCFRYEKDSPDVLKDLSFSVPAGSLFAIAGGNGSGKSTMLKTICGICKPYSGKITIFGKPLKKHRELFQNCLCMLPQDPTNLFVTQSVRAELEEMTSDSEKISEIAELCEIGELLQRHPQDLSGGEQQRLALAKVLLTQPKLLLLDEPTKGLDCCFKQILSQILRKLKRDGMTIIMVTHDVEFCADQADLVSMFFDGQLLCTLPPREFFSNNCFYTTAAARMSRGIFDNAVTADDIVRLLMPEETV